MPDLPPTELKVPEPGATAAAGAETLLTGLAARIRLLSATLASVTERDLQQSLALLLAGEGYAADREKALGPGDRPDFYLPEPGIAIEVKIKGTADVLKRQVSRYAAHPEVCGVLVVTTRPTHRQLPAEINGKPVRVAWTGRPF